MHRGFPGRRVEALRLHARMEELMLRCPATQPEARFDTTSAFEAELVSLMRTF
jgi:hypothetical protein